jgi:hypothetical protein
LSAEIARNERDGSFDFFQYRCGVVFLDHGVGGGGASPGGCPARIGACVTVLGPAARDKAVRWRQRQACPAGGFSGLAAAAQL